MTLNSHAKKVSVQLKSFTKLAEIRTLAKELKRDHALALELWSVADLNHRQLSILIMDKNELDEASLNRFFSDIEVHDEDEQNKLSEWFLATHMTKDKTRLAMIESWKESTTVLQRRLYWYHQGRLRWMGKVQPKSKEMLAEIDKKIANEKEQVQWAMNFAACWVGVFEPELRKVCLALGEKHKLYKNEKVSKGCTPNYLPEFIRIEVEKRKS